MLGSNRIAKLREYVLSESTSGRLEDVLRENVGTEGIVTVFLSVCNKKERARVFHGSGKTLQVAWANAEKWFKEHQKKQLAKKKPLIGTWAKADVVIDYNEIQTEKLRKEIDRSQLPYFFRKGIAFDDNFTNAYLESELNCNKMINYDKKKQPLDIKRINYYRKTYYKLPDLPEVPQTIKLFTTAGFFCDEDMNIQELYSEGLGCGRRKQQEPDKNLTELLINNASEYLFNMIKPDGSYTYGIFPIFHNEYEGYNILRHTGSIWALINYYRITNNEELLPKLKSAMNYLLDTHIEKDNEIAWVIERKSDEIKLGGNGLAVIMLTEYMDVFKTDEYIEIVRLLSNGILELQDKTNGVYWHVLEYPDRSRKEEFRTIYYDGEATFALARAYTFTKDKKYLDGAALAVENFITKDYTKYRDHWVAYSVNEVVKYLPEERYFEFAMQNVENNKQRILKQPRATPTNLELLMAAWLTFNQYKESGLKIEYIDKFDIPGFAKAIYERAVHGLNSFFFPEFAMYFQNPDEVLDSFFIRDDSFRIRIDDIQHFIGGYYIYRNYYDELHPYLTEK